MSEETKNLIETERLDNTRNLLDRLFKDILSEAIDLNMSGNFQTLETVIHNIQERHNVEFNLMKIRSIINKEFKLNCTSVFITDNNTSKYFFGANVIPTEKECYKIADNICKVDRNVKFDKCSEFVIELDSKLIYDLGATPEEVIAVLLHEIGHKVFYSISKVEMKNSFMQVMLEKGITDKTMIQRLISFRSLIIPYVLSGFTSTFTRLSGLSEEINSDSFAVLNGYAVPLRTVIDKMIDYGKGHGFSFAKVNKHEEHKKLAKWSINNVIEFKVRQRNIVKDLERLIKEERENSEVQNILRSQLQDIKNLAKKKTSPVIINESLRSYTDVITSDISYLELDEIQVEIDRIKDPEDKLYVLSRIHKNLADNGKKIKDLEKTLIKRKVKEENIKEDDKMKELIAYRADLMNLLELCRKAKTKEKYHHYIVGYPIGYEG